MLISRPTPAVYNSWASNPANPNQGIDHPAETSKEEIVGLVTALELFPAEGE